ncbi:acyl-CoA dehydrogenase [Uliginosibacterium sp. sgz301328]|uniref:acyl-CoA dehydrogenase n=1 Tax=Uliginosibacterium sp. sgz301328 TaxID=3243764 RepID=UPI00359E2AE9
MSDYKAPLEDMRFVLQHLADLRTVQSLPGCEEFTDDLIEAIFEEAGKFAAGVLSPLNRVGDREGARCVDGAVRTAPGWREAYRHFSEAGWASVAAPGEYGGQGLPTLISSSLNEMWKSANLAFSLCPMLTAGAVEAILARGSESLRATYLPKMVSGEWTGTMNLTEPQAGSDLSAVRTRAEPAGDGSYRLFGQKIFITYGEHDLADNIIHLVLARLPDAPEGVKGISLFVVPKFLVEDDGAIGARNDVRCVSIEHKLGIHASPTCVMAYGDAGGAVGYLVGEPHRGLEIMFVMMNMARYAVGMEGVAIAERAWQQALGYANERVQGVDAGVRNGARVPIARHPDVRRMLLLMKSQTEAMRALAAVVASRMDVAERHADADVRAAAQAFVDLMIPVVKGWSTETGIQVASLGVQVHGGMGYVEETGAAQHLRDARITTIYEGTTGIQAIDFIGRKIARDGGTALKVVLDEMRQIAARCDAADDARIQHVGELLHFGIEALETATTHLLDVYAKDIREALAGATPMLELMGVVCGGWQMARAALAARDLLASGDGRESFLRAKIATAHFYADQVLSRADGLAHATLHGGSVLSDDELLD